MKVFDELRDAFLSRDQNWAEAEQELIARRDELELVNDPVTEALSNAVQHELSYVYSLWKHDFEHAREDAVRAVDALKGGNDLRPYRAFWEYMAAQAIGFSLSVSSDSRQSSAFRDHIQRAVTMTSGVQWLPRLRGLGIGSGPSQQGISPNVAEISSLLGEWHMYGTRLSNFLTVREGSSTRILRAILKSDSNCSVECWDLSPGGGMKTGRQMACGNCQTARLLSSKQSRMRMQVPRSHSARSDRLELMRIGWLAVMRYRTRKLSTL